VGLRYAKKRGFDVALILNNDTIVVTSDFLKLLIKVYHTSPDVKIVGPKIVNMDGTFDGPMLRPSFWMEVGFYVIKKIFKRLLGCKTPNYDVEAISSYRPVNVYCVSGACFLIDLSFFYEIGFFDEKLWLSCEETDVCQRTREAGFKIMFQPLSILVHKKTRAPRDFRKKYKILETYYKQRIYFLEKHRIYHPLQLRILKQVFKILILLSRIKNSDL
jgi:GT2 family glycosyltransferase